MATRATTRKQAAAELDQAFKRLKKALQIETPAFESLEEANRHGYFSTKQISEKLGASWEIIAKRLHAHNVEYKRIIHRRSWTKVYKIL